jgi:uncharacterized coiled-coil protein SlyX
MRLPMAERPATALPSLLTFPKTVELEQRVSRAELTASELSEIVAERDAQIGALQKSVDLLRSRIVSLQAQIDHLSARFGRY